MWSSNKAVRQYQMRLLWLGLLATVTPISCDDALTKSICNVPGPRDLFSLSTTCPFQPSISTTREPIRESREGWVEGDACHDFGSTKFCSYTKSSFNDGFGVSMITTCEQFDELSSLPAFTKMQAKMPWRNAALSYHEAEVSGKGIGLVATRRIAAGELVLARTPAVLVDDEGFNKLGEGSLTPLLVQAIEGLPQQHQSAYLKLSTHEDVQSHDERIYQIFAKNNFRARIANATDFHATFIDGKLF